MEISLTETMSNSLVVRGMFGPTLETGTPAGPILIGTLFGGGAWKGFNPGLTGLQRGGIGGGIGITFSAYYGAMLGYGITYIRIANEQIKFLNLRVGHMYDDRGPTPGQALWVTDHNALQMVNFQLKPF
jgi:hypothetical protein